MPCISTCSHLPLIRQTGLGVPAAVLVEDLNISATDLRASACPEFSLYLLISDDTKSFCDCNKKQITGMLSKCPFQSCCKSINDKLLFEKTTKTLGLQSHKLCGTVSYCRLWIKFIAYQHLVSARLV